MPNRPSLIYRHVTVRLSQNPQMMQQMIQSNPMLQAAKPRSSKPLSTPAPQLSAGFRLIAQGLAQRDPMMAQAAPP